MDNEALKKMVHEAKCIILDIEGTISSIDYTRKEIFPYAEHHLEDYVMRNTEEVKKVILLFLDQNSSENHNSVALSAQIQDYQGIISYMKSQKNNNHNDPLVKQIQGLVVQDGFRNGQIKGHVYPDAVKALETWSHENKQVYTYSTGSRATQIEFFRNANPDFKAHFIKDYFDTSIGSKFEPTGFKFICDFSKVNPEEAVFFSDRPKEILGAKKYGMKTILVDRESEISMIKEEKEFLGYEDGKISSFTEILD